MAGPNNTFRRLRRHRAGLGRLLLLLFAFASASAGAVPCWAMAVPGATHTHHADAHMAVAAVDTSAADHSHSHAFEHDHMTPAADQDGGPHAPCSHCPPSAKMTSDASSGAHALCSTADHASDGAKPGWSPPAFKHVLSTALIELLPIEPRPRLAFPQQPPSEAASPSVALNLRHCVLLI